MLPFSNLSAGPDSSYFADGIHSELLNQLSRIGDLQVISRTSVLQYKEGARNLRDIGEQLGVTNVLEGSVQRAGDRVRIEVQLINAQNDRQMWADRYDRDLTDLFQIQSSVAEEIAAERAITVLRVDTNTQNAATQRLFPKLGYQLAGEIGLEFRPGLRFFCYEKRL